MTVWCVVGERYGVPYEDPGATELVQVHDSREGAQAAADEFNHRVRHEKYATPYDSFGIEEFGVLP